MRKSLWAGWILIALGVFHLVVLTGMAYKHIPGWFGLDLWGLDADPTQIQPSLGAFWSSYGSFAVPLMLLGAFVVHQARRGLPSPRFVGWGVGLWALGGAYLLEPTPFALAIVPVALILLDRSPRRDQATAAPKTSPTK